MGNLEPSHSGFSEHNKVKIYYEYYGDKDRPAILLMNGVAMEASSWQQFIPALLERYDVLIWDYRGQGKSTSDDKPYSITEYADYLKSIIDTLQLEPRFVNPVGVSFGSFVATEFIRKYPESVNKAILSGAILTDELTYHYQSQLARKILTLNQMEIWVDSLYTQLFSSEFLKRIEPYIPRMKEALFERYKDRKKALWNLLEAEDSYIKQTTELAAEYANTQVPILLIAGEYDMLTPPFVQKKICSLFPNVSYKEIPACGHLTFMEKAREFLDLMADFLQVDKKS